MNVNKPSQVRSTAPQEPLPDSQAVNKLSHPRTGGHPSLSPIDLMVFGICKGVIGLGQVYQRYTNPSQERMEEPSRPEQIFKNHKKEIDVVQRLLDTALPPDFKPFFSAVKSTATNYFALKSFLRGGTINPDSVKVTASATALAGILHARIFYPGSRGQGILNQVQSILETTRMGPVSLAPIRTNPNAYTKLLMVMAAGAASKAYTEKSSYSRLQLPQTESSAKLLRVKDEKNSRNFLINHSCVSVAAAILLLPFTRQKIGSCLLRLVKNPTPLDKSLSEAFIQGSISAGTGMWIGNRMHQSAAQANRDSFSVTPRNH